MLVSFSFLLVFPFFKHTSLQTKKIYIFGKNKEAMPARGLAKFQVVTNYFQKCHTIFKLKIVLT